MMFNIDKAKELLKEKGYTYNDLTALMKLKGEPTARVTIGKWFSKKSELEPGATKLKVMAEILGVEPNLLEMDKPLLNTKIFNEDIVSIPKLSFYAGAGSEGIINYDNTNGTLISVDKTLLGALNTKYLRTIEIIGDSMEPLYKEGDLALIDMIGDRYGMIKIPAVYIVRANGIVLIKRVEFLPNGGIKLISLNPSYSEMLISSDEDFEILGKVCGKFSVSKGLIFDNQGIN